MNEQLDHIMKITERPSPVMVRGAGSWLWDRDGKRYLDFVQGWAVNSFGHAVGYRNFDTDDQSRNNTLVAYLVFGEGFQNNHHRFGQSPNFAARAGHRDRDHPVCGKADKSTCEHQSQ